jgi:hypothetical protein
MPTTTTANNKNDKGLNNTYKLLPNNITFTDIQNDMGIFVCRDCICTICEEVVFVTYLIYDDSNQLEKAVADHRCEVIPTVRMIRV